MSLLRKTFLLCLALATALVVIAATYPRGGANILADVASARQNHSS
jgi:hypothetical protein